MKCIVFMEEGKIKVNLRTEEMGKKFVGKFASGYKLSKAYS
jgi:hypothetical protein